MIKKIKSLNIKKWFSKGDEDYAMQLPEEEKADFLLKLNDDEIGILKCENGIWEFQYSQHFLKNRDKFKTIVGFPELDHIYTSETLWPFFRVRIPGLKQPKIQEILEEEKIDKENEVALLKRFGNNTLANPYHLFVL